MIDYGRLNKYFEEKDSVDREAQQRRTIMIREWALQDLRAQKQLLWELIQSGCTANIGHRIREVKKAEKRYVDKFKTDHEKEWLDSWEAAGGWR